MSEEYDLMSIYFQDIPSRISLSAIDVTVTIEGFRYFLHTSFLRLYSESVAIFWSRCHYVTHVTHHRVSGHRGLTTAWPLHTMNNTGMTSLFLSLSLNCPLCNQYWSITSSCNQNLCSLHSALTASITNHWIQE